MVRKNTYLLYGKKYNLLEIELMNSQYIFKVTETEEEKLGTYYVRNECLAAGLGSGIVAKRLALLNWRAKNYASVGTRTGF